jgi:hypothetical protein
VHSTSLDLGPNHQFVLKAIGTEREGLAALVGASVQHRHETAVITLSEHNRSAADLYRDTVKRVEERPGEDDDRPPICPACGVTMGIREDRASTRFVCLECGFSDGARSDS